MANRGRQKAKALGVVLGVALLGALALIYLPLDAWLLAVVRWVERAGALGVVAFVALYAGACVLFIPGAILTLAAGFLFGVGKGFTLVSLGSTLGATAAFLLGRTVAREWVSKRLAGRPRFAAIDRAVASGGFRVTLLLRLSPVFPFILLNYALGLTRVCLRDYVLASWLGMMPGTLLYVYLGSLVTSAAELASGARPDAGVFGHAMLGVGLIATVAVVVVVTRLARRALEQALATPTAPPESTT